MSENLAEKPAGSYLQMSPRALTALFEIMSRRQFKNPGELLADVFEFYLERHPSHTPDAAVPNGAAREA